jgi:hypothetical protein
MLSPEETSILRGDEAQFEARIRNGLEYAQAPDDAIDAILSLLKFDPAARPTAAELRQTPYFM